MNPLHLLCSRFVAAVFLFGVCHGAELAPRISADFHGGEPVLDIAPGEKRLSRSALPNDASYNKHPYSGVASKRFSLKANVERNTDGTFQLIPRGNIGIPTLGAFNARSGTLAGWLRLDGKPGPLFMGRGGYLRVPLSGGETRWELGVGKNGNFTLRTSAVQCETTEALPVGWAHVAAVWDADHGARLYLNGEPVASNWGVPADAAAAEADVLYDSRREPDFFAASIFSRGTGQRGMVPLAQAAEWQEDSVAVKDGVLRVANNSGQRIQMRTYGLPRLSPGRYELVVAIQADKGAQWQPRLTIRNGAGSHVVTLKSTGERDRFAFEILPEAADVPLALSLNFQASGRYELSGVSVHPERKHGRALLPVLAPLPVEQLVLAARPEGGLRGLRIYDVPLSDAGVQALYEGGAPTAEQAVPPRVNPSVRRAGLGWEKPASATLPVAKAGHVLRFRQAPVLEALENRRAAGWLAVSGFPEETFPWGYHGYGQGVLRELNLTFGIAPNWMIGSGVAFQGTLRKGSATAQPFEADGPSFHRTLAGGEKEMTFTCSGGTLSGLGFYHVSEEKVAGFPPAGFPLRKGRPEALPEKKAREMVSVYPVGDRQLFIPYARESRAKEAVPLPALTTWHLATEVVNKEYALGGIGLRLRTTPLVEPTRARFVVHDPYTAGRELARVECVLAPSSTGEYAVRIDLREALLLPGTSVWVSLTLERDSALLIGNHGSELALLPAENAERAASLWKAWEQRSLRDRIERISESRPWSDVSAELESRWWLKAAAPVYEQIDDMLERLCHRFPDDATLHAWFAFTHPKAPVALEKIPLPEAGNHPEWAVLTLECLKQYRRFVDFWIDRRQFPNGEFGNNFNDDSDLIQDWLDLTLIADLHDKYSNSLSLFARGIATTYTSLGGRDGPGGKQIKGRPLLANGLNLRWTDVLHAYEDGINVQPSDFIAHYGDPIRFRRLLDTVSRYDGFILTPEQEGIRRFGSSGDGMAFLNTAHISGDAESKHWPLMLHAGLVAAWYNDDPAIWKMLEAVAKGKLAGPRPVVATAAPLLQAVFGKTGNVAYLEPLLDPVLWKNEQAIRSFALYANTYGRLPNLNREATLRELAADAAERFADHGSEQLGWADDRHLRNWLEWQFSGQEAPLLDGLRALYRHLVFLMPMRTVAEQSGDRVSPPKQLISQLYLGGVPGSRNRHFFPDFAVSYRGLDNDFAARVEENTPRSLRVRLYSFAAAPVTGNVRVWELEPGDYRIIHGSDGKEERCFLRRGSEFSVTLPPGKEQMISVEQVDRSKEPALLGDAAVSAETIQREENTLRVPVYNLGTVKLENVTVRLRSADGRVVAEQKIKELPALAHWKLGESTVTFEKVPQGALQVEVAPADGVPEITQWNNQTTFPVPPSAG